MDSTRNLNPNFPTRDKYRIISLYGRGRAELIRYILVYSGQPFEDCRLSLEEWKIVKRENDESLFLPILEINDQETMASGSFVIAKYLAQKFGLFGRNSEEAAEVDKIVEAVADLYPNFTPVIRAILGKQENKKKEAWEWFKKFHLTAFLEEIVWILQRNRTRNGFLVGKQVTVADLAVAEMLSRLEATCDSLVLKDHPTLKDHCDRIDRIPPLKNYFFTRPHSIL